MVNVKRVPDKCLKWAGRPEGHILRALTVTRPEHIDTQTLRRAFKRLSLSSAQSVLLIDKLKRSSLPLRWVQKLETLEF